MNEENPFDITPKQRESVRWGLQAETDFLLSKGIGVAQPIIVERSYWGFSVMVHEVIPTRGHLVSCAQVEHATMERTGLWRALAEVTANVLREYPENG